MNALEKIKAIQEILGVTADGKFGPKSRAALESLIAESKGQGEAIPAQETPSTTVNETPVDARSEDAIETLHPKVRGKARSLIHAAAAKGVQIIITSGTRTYEEQDRLFRQPNDGRDNDGDGRVDESDERVTKAPAGHSNHNFGLAFDVTIFANGKPVWESPQYATVGALGRGLGLTWGGNWSTPDEPHFELRPPWADSLSEPAMLAELRRRHEAGNDAFA